jgi:hypothetical protein
MPDATTNNTETANDNRALTDELNNVSGLMPAIVALPLHLPQTGTDG